MKPNLFHTQFFRLFFLILLAGISIQTYAAKDSQAAPKKRTITGTVISEGDNMPIIGANVWLKNSSTGAITDLDGKYFYYYRQLGCRWSTRILIYRNEYSGSCDRKPKRYQCDSKV